MSVFCYQRICACPLTYAAINASAGFSPNDSYFAPNSNGTTKSSSMAVRFVTKPMNSLNSSGVKCLQTSSDNQPWYSYGMYRESSDDCICEHFSRCLFEKSEGEDIFIRIKNEQQVSFPRVPFSFFAWLL